MPSRAAHRCNSVVLDRRIPPFPLRLHANSERRLIMERSLDGVELALSETIVQWSASACATACHMFPRERLCMMHKPRARIAALLTADALTSMC